MSLATEHVLMTSVRDTLRWRNGPKPTLNTYEVALLQDLASGASYSLKYSPADVRRCLRKLINHKCARIPYCVVDGVEVDLVEITDYGRETVQA